MIKKTQTLLFFIFFAALQTGAYADIRLDNQTTRNLLKLYPEYQEPEFFTFAELESLSGNPNPAGELEEKLARFFKTPIIDNRAYYAGAKPHRPNIPGLGTSLRVVTWNIEKSMEMSRAIQLFTASDSEFDRMMNLREIKPGSGEYKNLYRQRGRLLNADVILLQEMDIGVKRSQYMNAAGELAKALNMNYTYGAQYLEIDPVILGVSSIQFEEGGMDEEAMEYYKVDSSRYKGVFGSAVLSRYPIKRVELFPLRIQPYNWYWREKEKVGFLEHTRRFGTRSIFKNEITREMKVGGRPFFRIDLEVPDLPENTLTVINVHLEIKCKPEQRMEQLREILSYIREIRNPVVMAGDFNAAPSDISAISATKVVKNTLKNPTAWFSAIVNYVSPHGLIINSTRTVSNVTKNMDNPLARDISVIAPNPLKDTFEMIYRYRFSDGGAFDFRGDENRSMNGKDEPLANSNERDLKGFKTTFQMIRPWGFIGKFRLDWIFVKSFLSNPDYGKYKFAPHFGETLEELNTGLLLRISDHHPSVVDLPFEEPKIKK